MVIDIRKPQWRSWISRDPSKVKIAGSSPAWGVSLYANAYREDLAQLVRALDCRSSGHQFKSDSLLDFI